MSSTTEPFTLEQALAGRKFSWTSGVLVLNAILSVVQLSSYATGYDGSMMNGLQTLDTWQAYFNNPEPKTLGILNAIQNRFLIISCVGFFSQWSGNGLSSYYLAIVFDSIGYTSSKSQSLINGVLQIWGLVTSIAFALMVNKFKRRTLFLASTGALLVTFIVWTGLQATYDRQVANDGEGNPRIAKGILAIIFLCNLAYNIGWNPLQVTYVVEILPYHLRAKGLVLYNLFVAAALVFNQYANPIALDSIGWKYYIVYDVWIFVELIVVYFLFTETANLSLEQTAALLDGIDINNAIVKGVTENAAAEMTLVNVNREKQFEV